MTCDLSNLRNRLSPLVKCDFTKIVLSLHLRVGGSSSWCVDDEFVIGLSTDGGRISKREDYLLETEVYVKKPGSRRETFLSYLE